VTGFVSLPPVGPSAPPALADTIALGTFWPPLSLAASRAVMRIPTDITDQRLADALKAAMLEAAQDLQVWQDLQAVYGFASLVEVTHRNHDIGGDKRLAVLWRRAVHSLAMADLSELQRAADTTTAGGKRAESGELTVEDHRRNAHFAIRDIMGVARTTVELI
jgi:hypothetical protein